VVVKFKSFLQVSPVYRYTSASSVYLFFRLPKSACLCAAYIKTHVFRVEHLEPLSAEEFASLKEVGRPAGHGSIPVEHRVYLIAKGYIRQASGGLTLTDKGRLRVASGH
jgi:hypothetical protein